jgi:lipoprotein-anchoring transpeptidase ErfK/SrfK
LRRLTLGLLLLATLAAAPAGAQTPPPPTEARIADGVTVGSVAVGGMTEAEARTAVQAAFDRPLPFAFRQRRWLLRPDALGAVAYVNPAVAEALTAAPGEEVELRVRLNPFRVGRYAARLDRMLSREARNSELRLVRLRPFLTKPRVGFDVHPLPTRNAIIRAIRDHERPTIRVAFTAIQPTVTRANYGPVVVIRRGSRRLYLYRNMAFVRSFRIAVGMPAYPTPLGRYHVIVRERHPTWDPPNSPWAAGLGPVPPGPGNPLGTRWIGTSAPGIGIHGTPQPWTVGTQASHGCIRMYMHEVEWLFERVRVGTPVFIVSA